MEIKDYYALLQVEPSATLQEIRKAYRKLAKQYHPDINPHDPYAASQFAEIKEAYEVLTNPSKKEYYLQQRWFNQSTGKKRTQEAITPVNILKQSLELDRYVSQLDVFRLDKPGLQEYILSVISDQTIKELEKFGEHDTNRKIIQNILAASHPLPKLYADPVLDQLKKLAAHDTVSLEILHNHTERSNRKHRREKSSLFFIIVATAVICLLIWLAGH